MLKERWTILWCLNGWRMRYPLSGRAWTCVLDSNATDASVKTICSNGRQFLERKGWTIIVLSKCTSVQQETKLCLPIYGLLKSSNEPLTTCFTTFSPEAVFQQRSISFVTVHVLSAMTLPCNISPVRSPSNAMIDVRGSTFSPCTLSATDLGFPFPWKNNSS